MNPFNTPDRILVSTRPQDMRAGVQRLAQAVAADFGEDPADGALYCFVSRDCSKVKMLRFETNGWCLYYVRLAQGGFRWRHGGAGPALEVDRRGLLWLLEGLDPLRADAPAPVAARNVL